ncbi:MAG: alpha-glucosidase [Hespellia sp.]|nr:alpha-glucosidase [Hespellia sp.]
MGDLKGITEKLDYLQSLGIELIWICPVYCSPFIDQGYDVSDYYHIDPVFGCNEDMYELIHESKKRGIYIVMDLVVNHCSDQHIWFQNAMKDPYGKYGKYFYIREEVNGNAPCNWRSYFGENAWSKLPGHDNLYYLHLFAKQQPDINWENPEVREELYKMIQWWFDKGISGFRIDAAAFIKKTMPFEILPADREDGFCTYEIPPTCNDGLHEYLQEMKKRTFEANDAFTVGEVVSFEEEDLEKYISDDGCMSSIFDFSLYMIGKQGEDFDGFYSHKQPTANEFRDALLRSSRLSFNVGFLSNFIENHDLPRAASHFIPEKDISEISKKMLAGLNLMQYGLPFLYQGQEIGMENLSFSSADEIVDIGSHMEYTLALEKGLCEEEALKKIQEYSRDNTRSPMQWDKTENAGFTKAAPWMRINPNYMKINVAEQEAREDSLLNFYKKLILLRKNPEYKETLVYGKETSFLEKEDNFVGFFRKDKNKKILVMANFQRKGKFFQLPEGEKKVLINNYSEPVNLETNVIQMRGYQLLILDIK